MWNMSMSLFLETQVQFSLLAIRYWNVYASLLQVLLNYVLIIDSLN